MDLDDQVVKSFPEGYRYSLTIVDDGSRFPVSYSIRKKSETKKIVQRFIRQLDRRGLKVTWILADRGGEFTSLKVWLDKKRILFRTAATEESNQNAIAERMHQTLQVRVRAIMAHSFCPPSKWPLARSYATEITSVSPASALKDKSTPFEIWHSKKPDFRKFKTFGCLAVSRKLGHKGITLGERGTFAIFCGLSNQSKAYQLLPLLPDGKLDLCSRPTTWNSSNMFFRGKKASTLRKFA
jgi:transposase InsO family protein